MKTSGMPNNKLFIWLDDIRPVPEQYKQGLHAYSVYEAQSFIEQAEKDGVVDFALDLDHDLGDYADQGGDGIKLVLWLIETGRCNEHYEISLHTMNPVGRANMKALIDRYWTNSAHQHQTQEYNEPERD